MNTNVSEIDRATGIEYSRIGADPLTTVRTARTSHSVGIEPRNSSERESSTLQAPATVIVDKYMRCALGSDENRCGAIRNRKAMGFAHGQTTVNAEGLL
jgi:dUTPase